MGSGHITSLSCSLLSVMWNTWSCWPGESKWVVWWTWHVHPSRVSSIDGDSGWRDGLWCPVSSLECPAHLNITPCLFLKGPTSSESSPLGKQMREGYCISTSFDGFILVGGSKSVTGIYGASTICLALFQSPGIYISLNVHSSSLTWVLP